MNYINSLIENNKTNIKFSIKLVNVFKNKTIILIIMKTFEEWVNEANKIFNNKYEYIKIFKKDNKYYFFEIKCKIHGVFEKKIQNHIKKEQGCPLCMKPSKLSNELFINKAKQIHDDTYDYSNVNYINGHTKIKILCKIHGEFEQLPMNHLKGQNCPVCSNRHKITNELFIEKANKIHGNKYDYSQINYINSQTNIKILCKEHGLFEQLPINHLKGNQCYKCSNIVKNTEDFIKKSNNIHKNLYNYSKTKYKSSREKVIIICKIHGDFLQCPNDHLNGCGCNKCKINNYSKICIKWLENIMNKDKIFIQHANNIGEKSVILNNKRFKFDGYCEETNTVYELYGDIWHGNPSKLNPNDLNPLNKMSYGELYNNTIIRENIIKENGYTLITIWESELILNIIK